MAEGGTFFLRSYAKLAEICLREGACLYNMQPKLHYFKHILLTLDWQIEMEHERILNPVADVTYMDEDYIGRVSRLSRRVHQSQVHKRTLERVLVAARGALGYSHVH